MSLFAALTSHEFKSAEIKNNILTVYKHDQHPNTVLYSCFVNDIVIKHPKHGDGVVVGITGKSWSIEFRDAVMEFPLKYIASNFASI